MREPRASREAFIRTREIEEWTNLVFVHPLSTRVATTLNRFGVHPDVVSGLGMAFGVAAGIAYHHVGSEAAVVAGFLLMIAWHVMDGADGQLARLSGKTSEVGKVLDGLADHVAFASVYVGLATALATSYGANVWMIVVGAGLSHLVQSAAYEYWRQTYDYVVHGKTSARVPSIDECRQRVRTKEGGERLFAAVYLAYLHVQYAAAGADAATSATVQRAMQREADGESVREAYRWTHLQAVRRWAILCSNYRTLAIFIFCLAGLPLGYFLYEIVVLNLALLGLTRMQRRRNAQLMEWIAERPWGAAIR